MRGINSRLTLTLKFLRESEPWISTLLDPLKEKNIIHRQTIYTVVNVDECWCTEFRYTVTRSDVHVNCATCCFHASVWSPKWPMLCRVGHKTFSQSINQWRNRVHYCQQEAFEKCWAHSPLRAAARRTAIHQMSLLSHAACASMSTTTTTTTTTTTGDRGDRYGPIEWAQ